MALPSLRFVHVPLATLNTWAANYDLLVGDKIPNSHQQYSIAGRTFTRATLEEAASVVADVYAAIAYKNGSAQRIVYNSFST